MPPIPSPEKGEKQDVFVSRCMDNTAMNSEYPDNKQRYAICMSQLRGAGRDVPEPKKKGN